MATPSPCGLTSNEAKTVNEFLTKSIQFQGINFASALESPSLFPQDPSGQYPLYASGPELGSLITVNRDRLLETPFKPNPAFEIYVDSVFSYMFFQQMQKLAPSQALAKKVAIFWGKLFKTIGVTEFKDDRIELLVFKNNEVRFLLLDSYQAYVLNPALLKKMTCDSGFVATLITNYGKIGWTKYQTASSGSKGTLQAVLSYQCINKKGEAQNWAAEISADFEFAGPDKKKWNQKKLSITVNGVKKENRR